MISQGMLICLLFTLSVGICLFMYIHQKTSMIQKNINNLVGFMRKVEGDVQSQVSSANISMCTGMNGGNIHLHDYNQAEDEEDEDEHEDEDCDSESEVENQEYDENNENRRIYFGLSKEQHSELLEANVPNVTSTLNNDFGPNKIQVSDDEEGEDEDDEDDEEGEEDDEEDDDEDDDEDDEEDEEEDNKDMKKSKIDILDHERVFMQHQANEDESEQENTTKYVTPPSPSPSKLFNLNQDINNTDDSFNLNADEVTQLNEETLTTIRDIYTDAEMLSENINKMNVFDNSNGSEVDTEVDVDIDVGGSIHNLEQSLEKKTISLVDINSQSSVPNYKSFSVNELKKFIRSTLTDTKITNMKKMKKNELIQLLDSHFDKLDTDTEIKNETETETEIKSQVLPESNNDVEFTFNNSNYETDPPHEVSSGSNVVSTHDSDSKEQVESCELSSSFTEHEQDTNDELQQTQTQTQPDAPSDLKFECSDGVCKLVDDN